MTDASAKSLPLWGNTVNFSEAFPQKPSPMGKVDCRAAARRMRSFVDGIRAFIVTEAQGRAPGDLIRLLRRHLPQRGRLWGGHRLSLQRYLKWKVALQ